jgi:nicotine blue oxidoreductase
VQPTDVVGVVLAAGIGRRFGGFKALVPVGGVRMVDLAVAALAQAGVRDRLVVAHPDWPPAAYDGVDATVTINPDWAEGMGASLRVALGHPLLAGRRGIVLLLADQPGIGAGCVRRVLDAAGGVDPDDTRSALVQAAYAGRRGHPVLLGAAHWIGVREVARGDAGARAYLAAHQDALTVVDCTDVGDDTDVDRPGDLGVPGPG